MKKLLVVLLAALCVMAVLPVSALTKNGSLGTVPLYKGTITVDGKKDAIYDKGLKVAVDQNFSDAYKTNTKGTVYMLHDGTYLYMLIHVDSANPLGEYNPEYKTSLWKTTAVEVQMDWSNDATAKANNAKELFKLDANYIGDNYYGEFLAADAAALKAWIVDLKCTNDKNAKTYDMEIKMKFQEGAKAGSEVGMQIMIDSDPNMGAKNTSTQCQIACIVPNCSNDGSGFKNFKLGDAATEVTTAAATTKAAATAAKTTATSAKTADTSVVVALVATIALAGVVVCKKKH